MNRSHLKTICWLRWRLMVNQLNRLSAANRIISVAALVLGFAASAVLFFVAWLAGPNLLVKATPSTLMLVWTGLAAAFLGGWSIGVLTDLQRSEPLGLDKFLTLPVSPRNAFLMNYAGSFFSIAMFLMVPPMLGLAFAMVGHYGASMIFGVLLLGGFVLLVTAATFQFRGWLATLMVSKRSKRNVIALLTLGIILVSQIPNFLNLVVFRDQREMDQRRQSEVAEAQAGLARQLDNGELSQQEYNDRSAEMEDRQQSRRRQKLEVLANRVRIGNMFVPPGWMPLGIEQAASGRWPFSLACLAGLVGLSCLSLNRSFQTTLRIYRGGAMRENRKTDRPGAARELLKPAKPPAFSQLVGRRLPLLNHQQSAVATGMLASLARAPEAKLAVIAPFLVMLLAGATIAVSSRQLIPVDVRAFPAIGVCTFAMLGILAMIQNQFGYDRAGFRCYVLAPVPCRDVLIGKNAALAPVAFLLGALGLVALQIFMPMRPTHLMAAIFQLGTVYLITCIVGNLVSIYAPLPIAAGTMKPLNMNLSVVLLQLLITLLLPLTLLPAMIPATVELVTREMFGIDRIPLNLIGSMLVLLVTVGIYRGVISIEGRLLRDREQKILETVTQVGT